MADYPDYRIAFQRGGLGGFLSKAFQDVFNNQIVGQKMGQLFAGDRPPSGAQPIVAGRGRSTGYVWPAQPKPTIGVPQRLPQQAPQTRSQAPIGRAGPAALPPGYGGVLGPLMQMYMNPPMQDRGFNPVGEAGLRDVAGTPTARRYGLGVGRENRSQIDQRAGAAGFVPQLGSPNGYGGQISYVPNTLPIGAEGGFQNGATVDISQSRDFTPGVIDQDFVNRNARSRGRAGGADLFQSKASGLRAMGLGQIQEDVMRARAGGAKTESQKAAYIAQREAMRQYDKMAPERAAIRQAGVDAAAAAATGKNDRSPMSTASLIKQTRSRLADPIFGGSPGDATAFDVAVTGLDDDNAKRLVEVLSMNPADPNRIAMLERFKTKKPKQWNDALSNLYLGA